MIDYDVDPAVLLPLLLGLSRSSGCSSRSAIATDDDEMKKSEGRGNDNKDSVKEGADERVEIAAFLDIATLSFPAKLHRLLSVTTRSAAAAAAMPSSHQTIAMPSCTTTTFHENNVQSYYSHVLSWSDHGRSFLIHDPLAMEQIILRRYFYITSKNDPTDATPTNSTPATTSHEGGKGMELFERELTMWGFRRTCQGKTTTTTNTTNTTPSMIEKSSSSAAATTSMEYYHPDFLRCHFDKVQNMSYNQHGAELLVLMSKNNETDDPGRR